VTNQAYLLNGRAAAGECFWGCFVRKLRARTVGSENVKWSTGEGVKIALMRAPTLQTIINGLPNATLLLQTLIAPARSMTMKPST